MIFLSYSREDKERAATVAAALSRSGLEVWRDPPLLRGDPFWRETVRQALDSSDLLIVLWSRHAACSPWVDQEIRYFNKTKHFVSLDGADPRTQTATDETISSLMRQRADLVAAEETRLDRFRRDLGGKVAQFTQLNERTLRLSDGSVLIRLPANGSATYLAATPVTNEQYQQFITATGFPALDTWRFPSFTLPDAPVTGVSWFDAMAYAAWVGGDLPTQEEWEAAATAGDSHAEYATADGMIREGTAHFGKPLAKGFPEPTSSYSPNRLGFFGMCGNTWDWCSTKDGDHRRISGGGYMDSMEFCKVKAAYRNAPIDADCSVGFRVKVVI